MFSWLETHLSCSKPRIKFWRSWKLESISNQLRLWHCVWNGFWHCILKMLFCSVWRNVHFKPYFQGGFGSPISILSLWLSSCRLILNSCRFDWVCLFSIRWVKNSVNFTHSMWKAEPKKAERLADEIDPTILNFADFETKMSVTWSSGLSAFRIDLESWKGEQFIKSTFEPFLLYFNDFLNQAEHLKFSEIKRYAMPLDR